MAHGNDYNKKRYFWMKLDRHYFDSARIKKLRKLAGGDTLTIIYLKLCLLSIDNNCVLVFEGIEKSIDEELALKINEEVENVQLCIAYLRSQSMIEENETDDLRLLNVSVGSETQSNVYKKTKNDRLRLEKFKPSSNQIPIEIELDIEKDIDKDKDINNIVQKSDFEIGELFEKFWNAYPRKQGKDKCLKWFKKNKPSKSLVEKMVSTIEKFHEFCEQWKKQNGQFIPMPFTWLNRGGWDDEIEIAKFEDAQEIDESDFVEE